jgi:hypothetical protein
MDAGTTVVVALKMLQVLANAAAEVTAGIVRQILDTTNDTTKTTVQEEAIARVRTVDFPSQASHLCQAMLLEVMMLAVLAVTVPLAVSSEDGLKKVA